MEKHLKLVAILNIVYRGLMILGSVVLFIIAAVFDRIMDFVFRNGDLHPDDIPRQLLDIVPMILVIVGAIMFVVSIVAIVGAIGVMKKQEWGRITIIVISFFNLLHIPLGTALGVYSLWVLLNDEIVHVFNPLPAAQNSLPPS